MASKFYIRPCLSPAGDKKKPKKEVEKVAVGGQVEVEDEMEGQREKREKGTRGENKRGE